MKPKVLVVDDEPDIRLLARMILHQGGYSVVEAGTGEEGLDAIERETPDLVLLDLRLPGIQGWDVLARLRSEERWSGLPVVVVSAHASGHTLRMAEDRGSDAYLVKPFTRDALLGVVARFTSPT